MTVPSLDEFWGLDGGGTPVSGPEAVGTRWQRVEIDAGAHGLDELCAGRPPLLPLGEEPEGEPLVTGRLESGERVTLAARGVGGVRLAFAADHAVAELVGRAALSPAAPLTARLPVPYRLAPAPLRRLGRDLAVRRQKRSLAGGYPAWPVESSVEFVRHLWRHVRGRDGAGFAWPEGKRFALVLTHDVDSAGGLQRAAEIAEEETRRGLRSCWYVVGADEPLDDDALAALRAGGHEIGLHDAHHDNRGPFLGPAELGRRLDEVGDLVRRHEIRGYRSPTLLRTDAMYEALSGRFAYDSSMPDTGLLPQRNGCATVFPLAWGGVPVVPLTLPSDGQLISLGLSGEEIFARWVEKAEWVARVGGVAMILTHPEPGFSAEPEPRAAYLRFLDWAAARDDAWHTLPAELAEWWARR